MVDMAMISGAMTALKAVGESAKALIAIHDQGVLRAKVIELNTQIVTAQVSALAALSDQFALLEEVNGLKKQVADFEAWETEKQRYELTAPDGGAFVYALKAGMENGEIPHWLCANCYENRHKNRLQSIGQAAVSGADGMKRAWKCGRCSEIVRVGFRVDPAVFAEREAPKPAGQ
jgi:hypothetical protein